MTTQGQTETREEYVRMLAEYLAPFYGVSATDILGRRRKARMVDPRCLVYAKCHQQGWLYTEIGVVIGREHSTVATGARQAVRRMHHDRDLRVLFDSLPDFRGEIAPIPMNTTLLEQRLIALREQAMSIVAAIDERLDARHRSPLIARAS